MDPTPVSTIGGNGSDGPHRPTLSHTSIDSPSTKLVEVQSVHEVSETSYGFFKSCAERLRFFISTEHILDAENRGGTKTIAVNLAIPEEWVPISIYEIKENFEGFRAFSCSPSKHAERVHAFLNDCESQRRSALEADECLGEGKCFDPYATPDHLGGVPCFPSAEDCLHPSHRSVARLEDPSKPSMAQFRLMLYQQRHQLDVDMASFADKPDMAPFFILSASHLDWTHLDVGTPENVSVPRYFPIVPFKDLQLTPRQSFVNIVGCVEHIGVLSRPKGTAEPYWAMVLNDGSRSLVVKIFPRRGSQHAIGSQLPTLCTGDFVLALNVSPYHPDMLAYDESSIFIAKRRRDGYDLLETIRTAERPAGESQT
ncbi:hypothetical protein PHSY_001147 [Pseudozyma hubeiensis SY62]|uniref:Uncharacterized protein n=1 Tax=Pseudozyma hubeiensis (strain SY62) TaxID=1305764 RepID=R9NYA0_PSEHS|nr:hypothetical protein PHSY_001147 [Pseudozyma hubeiensis SY62]GAC93582.1 hypothetical protein PHSY_001147 [Pseudozyma hubeiensis SY62]